MLVGVPACKSSSTGGRQADRLSEAKKEYESGKFSQSEQVLAGVLKSSPDNVDALRTLALAQAAQGKNKEAIGTYGKIVGLQPKDDASWYRMALLERVVGESGPSEQHLEKALSLKPGDPSYTDELARTKMALGEYQEAASLWGDLLAGDALSKEGRKSVLVLQGQAYQAAKDYARAKKAFAAALKLDPSDDALRARVASFH